MAFLGALAFIVALVVSVMLHEAGHLVTAKRFGMKATEYFVGFGPTLWSRRRGETEYGIKIVLLGGYVKIVGYTPLEKVEPVDRPRAFYRQPAGRRAIVIIGGVFMNFLFAFLLLIVLAAAIGLPVPGTATTTVDRVSACVPASGGAPCGSGSPPSPARVAGLRAGDTILSFAGTRVATWDQLTRAIQSAPPGRTVPVVVRRDGRILTLQARLTTVGGSRFLGVTARTVGARVERLGPLDAVVFAGEGIGRTFVAIGEVLAALPAAVPKLFSPERAGTAGGQVGSVVGATEVSGQVFSAQGSWREKIGLYLALVASVNIFLGAFNVVPLLPLDGGHLAVVAYEKARGLVARARGRPDPGSVDMAKLLPITYAVVALLIGFGVLLILADILNPLRLRR